MVDTEKVKEFLKLKDDGYLHHRESNQLEFKENFNLASLAEYFKDFAGFANNYGGYLIFGVSDSPRRLLGMSERNIEQFNKIDPERITGHLLDVFSPDIEWSQDTYLVDGKTFGIFYISESKDKPVIAKKDEDDIIRNGDIFFRYGGRTQRIAYAELSNIIKQKITCINTQWVNQVKSLAKAGPQNAIVVDTVKGVVERNDSQVLVIDENLLPHLKFVKDGQGDDPIMKLSGEVVPMNMVEVTRFKDKNILEEYPYSYKDVVSMAKESMPLLNVSNLIQCIKDNNIKHNKQFSCFIFRNKNDQDNYERDGIVKRGTSSIYNKAAVDYIVETLSKS